MGAISVDPGMYPSLPLGGAWPFPGRDYLYGVEVFGEDDYRTDVNAIPIYEYDYRIEPNEDPEEIASPMYCALVVDNSADPGRGSTAYFGWSLIWCDWDSVAVLMGKILTDVCDEPSAGR